MDYSMSLVCRKCGKKLLRHNFRIYKENGKLVHEHLYCEGEKRKTNNDI